MGRAFAEDLAFQLSGGQSIDPVVVGALRDVPASGAARLIEGYYAVGNGWLRVQAVEEHAAASRRLRSLSAAGPLAEGMLAPAVSLARQLDGAARPPATRNAAALREYVAGLETRDPAAAGEFFQRAVAADPDFSTAYLAWMERLAARGDRAGALEVLAASRARAAGFPARERERLNLAGAALENDRAGQRRALAALAALEPADAGVARALAELDTAAHDYAGAVAWYEKAAESSPGEPPLWNALGYAQLWAGDFDGAVKALSRYRELEPKEANPLDSLGDAHYYVGRFAEAARLYLDAQAKNPAFLDGGELYKAAWARLMAGDVKDADTLFGRFLEGRQGARDPLVAYHRAQWEYLTGRRRQAVAGLAELARTDQPALATLAGAQLGIWQLDLGDRARALAAAAQAPARSALVEVCVLLAQPPASPGEWAERVNRAFPAPGQAPIRRQALAYALLYSKEFAAALPVLRELDRELPPSSPDRVDVLLAWAAAETGHLEEAARALRFNPPPDPTAEHPFLSLRFPRVLALRARLARQGGRVEEARRYEAMFAEYSGRE
jgi:hypothetical protein